MRHVRPARGVSVQLRAPLLDRALDRADPRQADCRQSHLSDRADTRGIDTIRADPLELGQSVESPCPDTEACVMSETPAPAPDPKPEPQPEPEPQPTPDDEPERYQKPDA